MKLEMLSKNAIATERKWFSCPYCGKNLVIVDNTARCNGIYVKCKKCKREVEIRI